MQKFLYIIIVFSLLSCREFETKKLSSNELVQEEIKHIDWKNLDTYPTMDLCDAFTSKTEKRKCFENEISKHIFEVLEKYEVVLKDSIREELVLNILISREGIATLENVEISDSLIHQIPELKEWLNTAVSELPTIYPAEKRGIPVSSNFKLPLIIQSE